MRISRRLRLAALAALSLSLASSGDARAAQTKAFVFGTDYTTGSLSSADLSPRTAHCDVASVYSDCALRYALGRLYVVSRFGGDNIQVIDPSTYATLKQFSVGNGSNPHDIAVIDAHKAYVSRYASSDLWIVDPATGAHTGTVSLAAFADADGIPEMDRMITVGPLLFVALERLDEAHGFAPTDSSLVAVIDSRTDTLVDCDPVVPGTQAIRLQLRNPATTFQFDRATSRLLIGCVGAYGALDGGIEWLDPVDLVSAGVAVTEAVLGGDVNDVVWVGPAKSYAIVNDASFDTQLVTWRASDGTKLATLWNPGGFSLADAEVNDRGELWVCNGSLGSPGVRVFAIATDAVLGGDLACTLPPAALVFDAGSGIASVEPAPAGLSFAPASPSPASTRTMLRFTLPAAGEARLEVFDAAGRRVRTLIDGVRLVGAQEAAWNLADDSGRRVGAGLYLVRLRAGGAALTRRVIVPGR